MLAAFVAGLAALLMLRFEKGDVYPPYSSLRSDPLGTRALFESLNAMAPDTARRWHQPPDQAALNPHTTFLICGLNPYGLETRGRSWKRLMDHLATDGGRIVITFGDRADNADRDSGPHSDRTDTDSQRENEAADDAAPDDFITHIEKPEDWHAMENLGIRIAATQRNGTDPVAFLASDPPETGLPPTIPWHGDQFFRTTDKAWTALYLIDRNDRPVVLRRDWGRGELVFAADSFLFSNEALRTSRSLPLLAWLLPGDRFVLFDEFHHGIARQTGIATLAINYGLEGIFGTMVFIGLLFVWRLSTTFVPPVAQPDPDHTGHAIAGGDSEQGLVGLMQQHIPPKRLISICFETWQKGPAGRQVSPERLAAARQWLEDHGSTDKNPVAAYRHITKLIRIGDTSRNPRSLYKEGIYDHHHRHLKNGSDAHQT